MSQQMGHDFTGVRVHTDAAAQKAADQLNAEAFALGADLFFAEGAFQPNTRSGAHLLAHELAHVIQHDEGRLPSNTDGELNVSDASDPLEREAETVADHAVPMGDSGQAAEAGEPSIEHNPMSQTGAEVSLDEGPAMRRSLNGARDASGSSRSQGSRRSQSARNTGGPRTGTQRPANTRERKRRSGRTAKQNSAATSAMENQVARMQKIAELREALSPLDQMVMKGIKEEQAGLMTQIQNVFSLLVQHPEAFDDYVKEHLKEEETTEDGEESTAQEEEAQQEVRDTPTPGPEQGGADETEDEVDPAAAVERAFEGMFSELSSLGMTETEPGSAFIDSLLAQFSDDLAAEEDQLSSWLDEFPELAFDEEEAEDFFGFGDLDLFGQDTGNDDSWFGQLWGNRNDSETSGFFAFGSLSGDNQAEQDDASPFSLPDIGSLAGTRYRNRTTLRRLARSRQGRGGNRSRRFAVYRPQTGCAAGQNAPRHVEGI